MAVQLKQPITQIDIRLLDLEEYHRLIEIGFFAEDERVELIEGVLHRMSPKGPRHAECLEQLDDRLSEALGGRARVRTQDPITIPSSGSEPEPDLIVFQPWEGGYPARHPLPEEVLLVVEVADSSLREDWGIKLRVYAAAGIEDYWVINLVDDQVEVYRRPATLPDGTVTYDQRTVHRAGDTIAPLRFPDCKIEVAPLLP